MSAGQGCRPFDTIARKWCDLAECRRAYFIELYQSGRWKHYYNDEQFIYRLRDVIQAAEAWAQLAGKPPASGNKAHPIA